MRKIIPKTKICILISILAIVGLSIGTFIFIRNNPTKTKPLVDTSFVNMSQVDQNRINGIVKGVEEGILPVTKEIKQELNSLFIKYNMTKEEIDYLKTVGVGFLGPNYDFLFFIDALESFKSGIPVKSEARKNLEELALTFGTMTTDIIKDSDEKIEKITKKEPAIDTPRILTEDDLNDFLDYSRTRILRIDKLFIN